MTMRSPSTFERVILVHGTGATADNHVGDAWWQQDGVMCQWLARELGNHVRSEGFIWSGANDEAARRAAGLALSRRISAIDQEGLGVHLIGHSHGGSVIWHALKALDAAAFERCVRSWSSVGTPFLHYGMRRARLQFALANVGLSGLALAWIGLSLDGVALAVAWHDHPLATFFWGLLWVLPLLTFGLSMAQLASFARGYIYNRERQPHLNTPAGAARYLCLWSSQDEPTIGLGASGSFSLRVLRDAGSASTLTALRKLAHPATAAINQLVNNLVSRAVQGTTIAHLELHSASSFPDPALRQRGLPVQLDQSLIGAANTHSALLGLRIRDILISGRDAVSGFFDLQRAAAKTATFKELVHTTYFDHAGCLELLIHHVRVTSALPVGATRRSDACNAFYIERTLAPASGWCEKRRPLPSNATGWVVVCGTLATALFIGLGVLAQGALHRLALYPTTIDYQLRTLTGTSQHLTAALAPTRGDDADRRKELRRYIANVSRADLLEILFDTKQDLSHVVNTRFESEAVPVILELANKTQLLWLTQRAANLLALRKVDDDTVVRPHLSGLIARLAEQHLLTAAIHEQIAATCAGDRMCLDQVHVEMAHGYVSSDMMDRANALLPLPTWKATGPPTSRAATFFDAKRLRDSAGHGKFLQWAAAHGEWAYVAGLFLHYDIPLPWQDYAGAVLRALQAPRSRAAHDALAFVLQSHWSTTLPADAIDALEAAAHSAAQADREPSAGIAFDVELARLADPVVVCNLPKGISSGIFRSEKSHVNAGLPCLRRSTANVRDGDADAIVRGNIKRAAQARAFGGNGGYMSLFPLLDDPAGDGVASLALAALLEAMKKDLCRRLDDDGGGWVMYQGVDEEMETLRNDGQVAEVFARLGRPPATVPAPVTAWMEMLTRQPVVCGAKRHAEFSNDARRALRRYTLRIGDWLINTHRGVARRLVMLTEAAGDPDRNAPWLLENGFYLDALEKAEPHDVVARIAYFDLATCAVWDGRAPLAQRLARLGQNAEFSNDAQIEGNSNDLYVAQAIYHFARRDWKAGVEVCKQCDLAPRLQVTNAILPLLIDGGQEQMKAAMRCPVFDATTQAFVGARELADGIVSPTGRISTRAVE